MMQTIASVGLSAFASLVGLVVFLTWLTTQNQTILSIHPEWVTMKPLTALAMACMGASACVCALGVNGRFLTTAIGGMWVTLFVMFPMILVEFGGAQFGLRDLFVTEPEWMARRTTAPGVPSVGAILAFVLLASDGLLSVIKRDFQRIASRVMSLIVLGMAGVAIVGYAIDWPVMYWDLPETSTAMAFHSAVGVAAIAGSVLLRQRPFPLCSEEGERARE